MSDELVRFLQARFTEDAARQQDSFEQWHHRNCEAVPDTLYPGRETGECDCGVPARVLAEVEAKRAILTALDAATTDSVGGAVGVDAQDGLVSGLHYAARQLASVYASHPDYRDEWRP